MFRIKPADTRVVVLPDELGEMKTKTGLIIPENAKEDRAKTGTIVVVGKGNADNPMLYSVGQRVIYSQYAGSPLLLDLKVGDKDYQATEFKIMNQVDIWGVIEEVK